MTPIMSAYQYGKMQQNMRTLRDHPLVKKMCFTFSYIENAHYAWQWADTVNMISTVEFKTNPESCVTFIFKLGDKEFDYFTTVPYRPISTDRAMAIRRLQGKMEYTAAPKTVQQLLGECSSAKDAIIQGRYRSTNRVRRAIRKEDRDRVSIRYAR